MKFEVKFLQNDRSFSTNLRSDNQKIDTTFSEFQEVSVIDEIEAYDGPYVVTPAIDSQVLPTSQKTLNGWTFLISYLYRDWETSV